MADGAGKYGDIATLVRKTTKARIAAVVIVDGDKGSGFSLQSENGKPDVHRLATQLRKIADELERS